MARGENTTLAGRVRELRRALHAEDAGPILAAARAIPHRAWLHYGRGFTTPGGGPVYAPSGLAELRGGFQDPRRRHPRLHRGDGGGPALVVVGRGGSVQRRRRRLRAEPSRGASGPGSEAIGFAPPSRRNQDR